VAVAKKGSSTSPIAGAGKVPGSCPLIAAAAAPGRKRFCVAAGLVRRATSKAVCAVLSSSLGTYGIPDEILTDNGRVFTGRFGPQPVEVLFDRISRENGISHWLGSR
jgi:hypothetical protein